MPQLLADAQPQRAPRLLGSGSPVRYYAPAAPLTFAATTITLIDSWRSGGDKRAIIAAAASTASATALSFHLIRTVNLRLLRSDEPLSASDRRQLARTWHQTNAVRLVALGTAAVALRQATRPAGDPSENVERLRDTRCRSRLLADAPPAEQLVREDRDTLEDE